jgi:hypothetical protein
MRSNEVRLLDRVKKLHLEPGDSIVVSDQQLGEMLMRLKWHTTFPINVIFAPEGMLSKADIPTLETALLYARKFKNDADMKDKTKLVDQSGRVI